MGIQRIDPYIWVTWLSELLAGEDHCEWSSWFKAHHKDYEKAPSDFDQVSWMMKHTALLNRTRNALEENGFSTRIEGQNAFTLHGKDTGITLGGKPDIIARKKDTGRIVDTKAGKPKTSHSIQVMIYMWAVPLALEQYRELSLSGRVVYEDHEIGIGPEKIDAPFKAELVKLIKKVGGKKALVKVPSRTECGFCTIAKSECPERFAAVAKRAPANTAEF